MNSKAAKWPKLLPPLSPEQQRINDAFVKQWHEKLPGAWYQIVERFNHGFPIRYSGRDFVTTLEIGAGLGEHLKYEHLTPEQETNYCALELRENMAAEILRRYPRVQTLIADCQQRSGLASNSMDRILAIHVLEHLPNLPGCIEEIYRVIKKDNGRLLVVIPTEGSLAYSIARKISAEREYRKTFGGDYSWFYKREHLNLPAEILQELSSRFTLERKSHFPFPFAPFLWCNLCLGLVLRPRR